jgi:hypothetical protein
MRTPTTALGKGSPRCPVSLTLAFTSCVVALLLILRGIFAPACSLANSIDGVDKNALRLAIHKVTCLTSVDQKHPSNHDNHTAECCIFCNSCELRNIVPPVASNGGTALSPPSVSFPAIRPAPLAYGSMAHGWAATWSSRAPPARS